LSGSEARHPTYFFNETSKHDSCLSDPGRKHQKKSADIIISQD
jgi:hypothetical protein